MLTLAHLSDPHISTVPESLARLGRALDLLPATKRPAVLLVTGDLADHGAEAEYRSFRAALPEDLPLVSCPGNHDEINNYRAIMLEDTSGAPAVRAHELPGLRLVSLDSTIPR